MRFYHAALNSSPESATWCRSLTVKLQSVCLCNEKLHLLCDEKIRSDGLILLNFAVVHTKAILEWGKDSDVFLILQGARRTTYHGVEPILQWVVQAGFGQAVVCCPRVHTLHVDGHRRILQGEIFVFVRLRVHAEFGPADVCCSVARAHHALGRWWFSLTLLDQCVVLVLRKDIS